MTKIETRASWINMYQQMSHYWWKTRELCTMSYCTWWTKKSVEYFFLDAPGGTGNTFVINLLLAKIRQQSKIAIAMASSGIAAALLHGGRTAHSTLKLPLNLEHSEAPLCNITKGTGQAKVLQECVLIVWDECTMSHKHALEALDRTLQDLRNNQALMSGVVVLLAGDIRQTLPVYPKRYDGWWT